MVEKLHIPLDGRAYDILFGPDLCTHAADYISPYLSLNRVAIITEENVAAHHLASLEAAFTGGGIKVISLTLPAGESTKSWDQVKRVTDWFFDNKLERNDLIIAFGGGVIGDLIGFCAAIFRRGVDFIQIPTTLLAQVDSAVGGKTGINNQYGKNLIGAFHQPKLVLADISLLDTLPDRDFLSGYGEVVKYGLLGDYAFFEWLEENSLSLLKKETTKLTYAIQRSCALKSEIVLADEREAGQRAHLNLGHTFGHALEAATGYGAKLLHGEGVAIGCVLAAKLSAHLGLISTDVPKRIITHLKKMGMKTALSDIAGDLPDADGLIALMQQDKKVQSGKIHLILLHALGQAFICSDLEQAILRDFLDEILANDKGNKNC